MKWSRTALVAVILYAHAVSAQESYSRTSTYIEPLVPLRQVQTVIETVDAAALAEVQPEWPALFNVPADDSCRQLLLQAQGGDLEAAKSDTLEVCLGDVREKAIAVDKIADSAASVRDRLQRITALGIDFGVNADAQVATESLLAGRITREQANSRIESVLEAQAERALATVPTRSTVIETSSTVPIDPLPFSRGDAFVDELATQIAIQLRSAAEVKLLRRFGDQLCSRNVVATDVRTFFPQTCNFLLRDRAATEELLPIASFGTEFRRVLQNDLKDLPPAVVTHAVSLKDGSGAPAVAALVGLLAQNFASGELKLVVPASCDPPHVCSALRGVQKVIETCTAEKFNAACAVKALQGTGLEGNERGQRLQELLRRVAEVRTRLIIAKQSGSVDEITRVGAAIAVARAAALALLPDNQAGEALSAIDGAEQKALRWADLALTVYQIARGIHDGEDALALFRGTLVATPCGATQSTRKVHCGLKLAAITIDKIERQQLKLDAFSEQTFATLAASVMQDVDRDPDLKSWVAANAIVLTDAANYDRMRIVVRRTLDLRELLIAAKQARDITDIEQRRQKVRDLYPQIVQSSFALLSDASRQLFRQGAAERTTVVIDNVFTAYSALEEKRYGTMVNSLFTLTKNIGTRDPLPPAIASYRPLITALADARDEETFRSAVRQITSQGCTDRLSFRYTVCIAAIPGLSAGWVQGSSGGEGQAALFAPVGIDLFWGKWGITLAPLDLGNVVSAKLTNGEQSANAELRDVFAPGVAFRREIRRSGTSVGIGVAAVPTAIGDEEAKRYALRVNVFAAYALNWLPIVQRQ